MLKRALPLLFLTIALPARAQTCPKSVVALPKSNALYLYFPAVEDPTFPVFTAYPNITTSPLKPFDMASHDASIDADAMRARVVELMRAGYCEFDVDVRETTTKPTPSEPRWQIIGIGSDNFQNVVGLAEVVDTGDADAQDFARIWVDSLKVFAGTELSGADSTLERWATAIANVAAHESGHNYGSTHYDADGQPTEDVKTKHFMLDPLGGATPVTMTARLNHFSDRSYERFGHDIGLVVQTLHNWDFINPNMLPADTLTVTVLSAEQTLTIGWWYTGSLSPWTNPTVTKRTSTITFRGTAYNVFDIVFSTPQAWDNGQPGIVLKGETFHTGVSVVEPGPMIVYDATLSWLGQLRDLRPRMIGYDAGTKGSAFFATFVNPGEGELELSDIEVLFLPRMLDIEQMVTGGRLIGRNDEPVIPHPRRTRSGRTVPTLRVRGPIRLGRKPFELKIAELSDRRHLDLVVKKGDCESASGFGVPRVVYCPKPGNALSLFPATFVYISATITDRRARFYDKKQQRMVEGPLSTRVFFQTAGVVPDANRNGRDDLLDARMKRRFAYRR